MSLSVGGINLAESAINTELRLIILEKIVEHLLVTTPNHGLTPARILEFRTQALSQLQAKYPGAGIASKPR
jgi:hypothetical protein